MGAVTKVIDLIPGESADIDTVDASSLGEEEFWNEYVCRHRPVIIRGATAAWPSWGKWQQPGHLEALCAEEKVTVWPTFNVSPKFKNAALRTERLADCIRAMRSAPDDVTISTPSINLPAGWLPDVGTHGFLGRKFDRKPRRYPRYRLFVYKNASTAWHYHAADESITTQMVGSKKIALFRLTRKNWEEFGPLILANYHHLPEGRQYFPEHAITKFNGVIEEGDSIYIPPFWWHGIDPVDTDFGVTLVRCFRSPLSRVGDWNEPITWELINVAAKSYTPLLPYVLGLISLSSIKRLLSGENWWPIHNQATQPPV
jgi:hypothetical protein